MTLAGDDFAFMARLLRRRSGLVLGPDKAILLDLRLKPVIRRFGLSDLPSLVRQLRLGQEALAAAVTEAMTVNETSFFRDSGQFDILRDQVLPRLRQSGLVNLVTVHRKINLFGKGESEIEAQAMDLTARGRVPEVGITAHDSTISFRISASGTTEDEARRIIEPTAKLIYERFASLLVGEGSDDVPEATVAQLAANNATLATAESCTGGVVAQMLTAIAGVSSCYLGGAVSYANDAKIELLGVSAALIETHGAVSPEVAAAMAEGVRERLGAGLGLSTTGVAGPAGGSPEKPVGLVYLGLATANGTQTRRLDIGSDQPRDIIQRRASQAALNWVRLTLLEKR